ncbi:MAG: ECF transporter S component [Erysipelotrichaceae bacterium]|nr:ECF transporter S component [Erysipelotrichaceae bacterium]
MNKTKTKNMTIFAMLLAIEIILVMTPLGYLPIGVLSITTMHIPVIIAGILLGKKEGAALGFVFGLTSMIRATLEPSITSFCFSPFITIGEISGNYASLLIAFVPRILLGFVSGLIYEKMIHRFNNKTVITISALAGTLTNTILVLSGIYIFFGQAYASVLGIAYETLIATLLMVVASNGIIEAIVASIVSVLVCQGAYYVLRIRTGY